MKPRGNIGVFNSFRVKCKSITLTFIWLLKILSSENQDREDIWFFLVKDRNLFHQVDTISNIFTSGAATSENITDGVNEMK